ncbi:MAG: TIGR01440 family protein [Clostridia bacterium]|nr:TIGR01440 family protein [Clostridia bacterium]
MLNEIRNQAAQAAMELCEAAGLKKGDIFVAGCSSSEVGGEKIGTSSSEDIGKAVFEGIYQVLQEKGVFLATQCCEHLNRSLVIERECCEKYNLEEVCVVPQPKAGGSFATAAYKAFKNPVVVEEIKGNAGIDIGGTLIGMHLKRVCVPVRLSVKKIGQAAIICAKTRPRLIGGERAIYNFREDVER